MVAPLIVSMRKNGYWIDEEILCFVMREAEEYLPAIEDALKYRAKTALAGLESEEDKKVFARAIKAHMGKAFKNSKAGEKLAPFLRL